MLVRVFIVSILMLSVCSVAAGDMENHEASKADYFTENKHYQILEHPLPQTNIPIIEFMYFGCKVCLQLVDELANWSHKSGIGIALVPAHSETVMVQEARMFHTFEEMGVLDKMYQEGYILVQTNQSRLHGADRVNDVLDRKGIDKKIFWQIWESDAVIQRLKASEQLTKQVKITKTPTFVVHGIYKVDVESLKSVEELFELLSYLVAKKSNITPPLLKKRVWQP